MAVVVVDQVSGRKLAFVGYIPAILRERWAALGNADHEYHYIAMVEQAAIIMGLNECATWWSGRDIVWFIDNSVVLAGAAKGQNHNDELDSANAAIQLTLAQMRTRCWWEYISSEANWADGPSRLMERDPWLAIEGFVVKTGRIPVWPWMGNPSRRVVEARKLATGCCDA